MSRSLFTRIVPKITDNASYFQQSSDCTGRVGISPLMKCTSVIRQLAYDTIPDALDEYLQMDEKTSRDSLQPFYKAIMDLYGYEFLRRPTYTNVGKLYTFHEEKHGFSEILGSIDCTSWSWANCPNAYRAQYCRGNHRPHPFILLKVIASQDLWIWHAFFGVSGVNNDINVIRQSPVFNDLKDRKAPEVPFVANDVTYKWEYYLTDVINSEWSILIKSISQPRANDTKVFK